MNIPPQYKNAVITEHPGHAEAIKEWMVSELPGVMTFVGPCGTGKTRMLYAIAQNCREPMLWDVPTLVVKTQRGMMLTPDAFNSNKTHIIDVTCLRGLRLSLRIEQGSCHFFY